MLGEKVGNQLEKGPLQNLFTFSEEGLSFHRKHLSIRRNQLASFEMVTLQSRLVMFWD